MQREEKSGKLTVRKGFVVCPVCKMDTNQFVRADTTAHNLQIWCRNCKSIHIVNIDLGQCFVVSRCQ